MPGAERSCRVVVASEPFPVSSPKEERRKKKKKASWEGKEREQGESGIPGMALHGGGAAAAFPGGLQPSGLGKGFPWRSRDAFSWPGMAEMGKSWGDAGIRRRPRSLRCLSHGAGVSRLRRKHLEKG